MSNRQAVVTLNPLFFPDEFPFRVLTFASESDRLGIGRASRRESKNLIPAHHNGWFYSRVVSRNHATLRVSFENKDVFIRDGGSMHGTWVNDKKLPVEQDTIIHDGDVLTFGTDVTRGAETFSPLKVRCECQWFENRDKTPVSDVQNIQTTKPSNCFTAPEDDYDSDDGYDYSSETNSVNIVYDSITPGMNADHHSEPGDTEFDTDRANRLSPDCSTAVNSPSVKNENQQDCQNDVPDTSSRKRSNDGDFDILRHDSHKLGVEQSIETPKVAPFVINCPNTDLATNTRSPYDAATYDVPHSAASASHSRATSIVEPEDWDPKEKQLESEDRSMSRSPFEFNSGQSDKSHYSTIMDRGVPIHVCDACYRTRSPLGPAPASSSSSVSDEEPDVRPTRDHTQKFIHDEIDDDISKPPNPVPHEIISGIEQRNDEQPRYSYADILYNQRSHQEGDWAATPRSDLARSRSFKPIELSHDRPLSRFQYHSLPTTMEDWTPDYPIPANTSFESGYIGPYAPYTDGPFVYGQSDSQRGLSSQTDTDYGKAENGDDISRSAHEQGKQPSNETIQNKTRVSIADIVDFSSSEPCMSHKSSLKRKATEMESDSIAAEPDALSALCSLSESAQWGSSKDESYSQNAQPRNSLNDLKSAPSQIADLTSIEQEPSTSVDDEPASKRVKRADNKGGRGIAGYAATAFAGAVAGGLGTVALLASLPPDFFH